MVNADLIAAIRDLRHAIVELTDELRQHRQADQEGIGAISKLHKRPMARDASQESQQNSVI